MPIFIWFISFGVGCLALIIGSFYSISCIRNNDFSGRSIIGIITCSIALVLCIIITTSQLPGRIDDYNAINEAYTYNESMIKKNKEADEKWERENPEQAEWYRKTRNY